MAAFAGLAPMRASEQASRSSGQPVALRIVVIEGEDAVNIIQQKTAVAPVIEVRDRNDLPVPGAVVTFTIAGKSASFAGGAQTLTVATNAAGRAAAAALNPLVSGGFQIQVSAAFQGQTVVAAIAQTNVLTAAEAAQAVGAASGAGGAGGGGGSAGAAGGAATGGGGGGISATTIGIVGGVAAAGAVAATQLTGEDTPTASQDQGIYQGPFTMDMTWTFGDGRGGGCNRAERSTGTLQMELTLKDGIVTGTAQVNNARLTIVSGNCPNGPQTGQTGNWGMPSAAVTGSPSSISFTQQTTGQAQDTPTSAPTTVTTTWRFTGAQSGTTIAGDFFMGVRQDPQGFPSNSTSGITAVTLNHIR